MHLCVQYFAARYAYSNDAISTFLGYVVPKGRGADDEHMYVHIVYFVPISLHLPVMYSTIRHPTCFGRSV